MTRAGRQAIEDRFVNREAAGVLLCILGAFVLFCVFGAVTFFALFPGEEEALFLGLASYVREPLLVAVYAHAVGGGTWFIAHGVLMARSQKREREEWVRSGRPLPPQEEAWIRAELQGTGRQSPQGTGLPWELWQEWGNAP
jgi:hypothetical protein